MHQRLLSSLIVLPMRYHHVTPILYSSDVLKSIQYYTETLGFENSWNWGEPPTFGGVSKNGVEIFFCEKARVIPAPDFLYLLKMLMNYMKASRQKAPK